MAGVGYETNKAYRRDGYRTQQHSQEDYSFHFELDKDLCLYGVFDGHDGCRAAHFAHQRMPGGETWVGINGTVGAGFPDTAYSTLGAEFTYPATETSGCVNSVATVQAMGARAIQSPS